MQKLLYLSAFLAVGAPPVLATGHPFTELEIPLPDLVGTHARATGMGKAHIAVAEDASALSWNPAGLAHVERIEVSATVSADGGEIETTWHSSPSERSRSDGQLAGLHFLYPFPTYRGSLVLALGIDRLKNYDLQYSRSGEDDDVTFFGGGAGLLTDTHDREGKLTAVTAGLGWDASPRLSLGGNLSVLTGSIFDEQSFLTEDAFGQSDSFSLIEDYFLLDMDISGFTALVGFLYQATPQIRFGGVFGVPRYLSFERFEQRRELDQFDNGTEEVRSESRFLRDEEITFPWWAGFGLSYAARGLMLAADVRYTDWRDIKDEVGGFEFFLQPYYEEATSFSLGGEYLVRWVPLRVRAGYHFDPVPFNLTYCPFDECISDGRDPGEIDVAVDKDRHVFSVGGGYLLGSALAVDFAYEKGSFERVIRPDPDLYGEKRTTDRFILTAAYRF